MYKFYPNSTLVCLKLLGYIDAPLFNLCSVVYEIELFTKWVPFCYNSFQVLLFFFINF